MRALLAAAVVTAACASGQSQPPASACAQVGRAQFLPDVPEASGIALAGGVLWTHNDSATPALYRIDRSGRAAPVTVVGADMRDWEDLATWRCGVGECLYIADIGDNQESRHHITLYVVLIPAPGAASTKVAAAIHLQYPDRPHDAEALVMTTAGTFIITKDLPARVYRFVAATDSGQMATLTLSRTLNEKGRITGAAASPDGGWIALRSNRTLFLYTLDDFVNGGDPVRVDLDSFEEPQGEGVTFGSGGNLYLVSEGGGKNAAGILTHIHCAFLR